MHSLEYSFCPAMLCKRGLCRHAVSVYLSVRPSRSWTLSKRINTSSKNFRHRVATPFWFFCTKRYNNIPTATSLAVASNAGRVGTNLDCGRIAGNRLMPAGRASNCDGRPCSLSHRRRLVSESLLFMPITACSMDEYAEEKRTEFNCSIYASVNLKPN